MKILYLVTNFHLTGGKGRYDKNLIQELGENEEGVRVVMLKGPGFLEKTLFIARIMLRCLTKRWDFVFCAHIPFAPLCFFFSKIFGFKYIVIAHGIEAWGIKGKWQRKALEEASIIIAVSEYTRKRIIEQFPKTEDRIFMLPNSVNGELFTIKEKSKPLIQKLGLDGAKIILTVSRLYPAERDKGYYKVIGALPLLKEKSLSVKYIIVGSGSKNFGDARNEILVYAQKKGVIDNVILPGFVSDKDLVDYYNLCDVFIMPSKQEGFGIVFAEALACGKPVIVGNKDASREAIMNGELGLLVDPENVEKIAEALAHILRKEAPKHFFDREFLRKKSFRRIWNGQI